MDSGSCSSCPIKTFKKAEGEGACISCGTNVKTCDSTTGNITACNDGFSIKDNQCVEIDESQAAVVCDCPNGSCKLGETICNACDSGYQLVEADNTCKEESQNPVASSLVTDNNSGGATNSEVSNKGIPLYVIGGALIAVSIGLLVKSNYAFNKEVEDLSKTEYKKIQENFDRAETSFKKNTAQILFNSDYDKLSKVRKNHGRASN